MEDLGVLIGLVGFVALVYAAINFLKYLTNQDWNGVVTQLTVWAAGVGVTLLGKATSFAADWAIGDRPLGDFTTADAIYFGLLIGSVATAYHDRKKALDSGDSAKTPELLGGKS